MKSEIEWSDTPPTQTDLHSADLRRCPPGGMPPAIILVDWITGNELHWWNGRSFPHLANDCPACAAKRARVWKGYLACLELKTRKIFILEITPNCTEPLAAYKLTFGSLRGAQIKLERSATKINGRVTATVTPAALGGLELPQPPDVRNILRHMWQTDHRAADDKPEVPRPVVEAPQTTQQVIARRALTDRRFQADQVATKTIPIEEAGELLSAAFTKHNPSFKKNGEPT